ncbi:hypothetical protein [Paenibacillus alba]|uniref:Uncharacterized protein n=1 Tax=Paenibacillus alba TaxID=1197127 RepID=A0ABU6GAC8_9BACL|nr:hypothetical protein [Paenibacillus alba]MEC0229768.1 hypothetical protein [Paenibacillus alba]
MPYIIMVIGIVGYIITRSIPPYYHFFMAMTLIGLVLSFVFKRKATQNSSKN